MEDMPKLQLTVLAHTRDIALSVIAVDGSARLSHIYPALEQYPLANDRYINDRPNLFVDVLDVLDGNEPRNDAGDTVTPRGSAVSLRTLAQRAQRAAADGSGNARRFKDARDLWAKLGEYVDGAVRQPEAEPIVDVRKNRNWKKNQPMKEVRADPDAWFVTEVFSRSNPRKDAVRVYRGLDAVFDTLLIDLDDIAGAAVSSMRGAIVDNLDYPTYQQIANALNDSNMLVFHRDADLAAWIREQAKGQDFLYPDTPAHVFSTPTPELDEEDPEYRAAASTMTASHLANVIAPK